MRTLFIIIAAATLFGALALALFGCQTTSPTNDLDMPGDAAFDRVPRVFVPHNASVHE